VKQKIMYSAMVLCCSVRALNEAAAGSIHDVSVMQLR
jgi:hypothetical protein